MALLLSSQSGSHTQEKAKGAVVWVGAADGQAYILTAKHLERLIDESPQALALVKSAAEVGIKDLSFMKNGGLSLLLLLRPWPPPAPPLLLLLLLLPLLTTLPLPLCYCCLRSSCCSSSSLLLVC